MPGSGLTVWRSFSGPLGQDHSTGLSSPKAWVLEDLWKYFTKSNFLAIDYKDDKDPMEWWEYYESEHQEIAKLELIWNDFSRCSLSC